MPQKGGNDPTVSELLVVNKELADALATERYEHNRTKKRYQWAANELLACDYGDNDAGPGVIGWLVYGWRDKQQRPHAEHRRIFGANINEAIDAELP